MTRRPLHVETPHGAIAAWSAGSGDALPVVLLHGLNGSSQHWERAGDLLSRERPVIALDLRGHGASSRAGSCDVLSHVDDLARVIDTLDERRAHVMGASFGGVVALATAAAAPERVVTVTTLGTALHPAPVDMDDVCAKLDEVGAERFFAWVATELSFGSRPDPALVAEVTTVSAGGDVDTIKAIMRAGLAASPEPYVGDVRCPVLVAGGAEDRTCPLESVAALARAVGTDVHAIEEAGHLAHLERPAAVADLIRAHIRASEHAQAS